VGPDVLLVHPGQSYLSAVTVEGGLPHEVHQQIHDQDIVRGLGLGL
jgi:hypothetical protein